MVSETKVVADGLKGGITKGRLLDNPNRVNALFGSTHLAWVWMLVRIYLGVSWLNGGWHKLSRRHGQEVAWL
jgi:hypothetical protein